MYIKEEKSPIAKSVFIKITFVLTGIITGFFISRIFFQTYAVKGDSMLPNLKNGDSVIIFKGLSPETGDIVLFTSPLEKDRVMLKRLIAKDGDVIEIRDKNIYINSRIASLPWDTRSIDKRILPEDFSGRDNLPALRIKKGEYFFMGDNLDYSFDSRNFGPVSDENIIGKVIFKY